MVNDLEERGIDGTVVRPGPRILDDLFFQKGAVMGTFPLRQRLDDTIRSMVLLSHSTGVPLVAELAQQMRIWVRSMLEKNKKEEFEAYVEKTFPPELKEEQGEALFFEERVHEVEVAFSDYVYARGRHFTQSLQQTNGLVG